MEAGQIMMMPVATDTGMATGMETDAAATTGTGSSNGFGEVLAKSILGTEGTEAAAGEGEKLATVSSQEQSTTPEILLQPELNIQLISQLATFQIATQLQQTDQASNGQPVAETTVTSLLPAAEGTAVAVSAGSLRGEAPELKQLIDETGEVVAEPEVKRDDVPLESSKRTAGPVDLLPESVLSVIQSESARTVLQSEVEPTVLQSEVRSTQQAPQPVDVDVIPAMKAAAAEVEGGALNAQGEQSEERLVNSELKLSLNGVTAPAHGQSALAVAQQAGAKTVVALPDNEGPVGLEKIQENQKKAPLDVARVLVKDGSQSERQPAAEAQPLSQEVTGGTKNGSVTTAQFRFAQPTDVVLAASGSTDQHSFSSNPEQAGSQLAAKLSKPVASTSEVALPLQFSEQLPTSVIADHQLPNPQIGHQKTVAAAVTVVETPTTVVPEQVGRQVMERLGSHEIKQGNDQISFKLSPEHLGNLQLNMRMDDQRLKLEIVAESREVRNALLLQADELKESLSRQNIRMDSFDVTTGSNGNSQQQSRDWRQMSAEQRQLQPQYAARAASASNSFETPVRYFAKQYQSTIDVRF